MADFREETEWEGAAGELPPGGWVHSLSDELTQLIASVRAMATTELAYQSARARLMGKAAAWCAAGAGLGLALLFFALMALVVGSLLALAPMLGAWGAMGAVIGGLVLATLIAALVGWLAFRRFMALLRGKGKA